MYICTRLGALFVSQSFIPHWQPNSYIHLFLETSRTHILPHTHLHIRVLLLLRGQFSLAYKIIHISIVLNMFIVRGRYLLQIHPWKCQSSINVGICNFVLRFSLQIVLSPVFYPSSFDRSAKFIRESSTRYYLLLERVSYEIEDVLRFRFFVSSMFTTMHDVLDVL